MDNTRKLIALAIFICLLFPAVPAKAQGDLNDNLVACWDFEEPSGPRADAYAFNHWTDNNTVQTTTGVNGAAAMFVSGNSEYLSRTGADSPLMNPGTTGPFSVAGWFRIDAVTTFVLMAEGASTLSNIDWEVSGFSYGSGNWYLTASINGGHAVGAVRALTVGQWYHLAFTQGANVGTVYLNGSQIATGTFTLTNNVGNIFGINKRGITYGTMSYDSLQYFNDVLSLAEIGELYNSGAGLSCDDILATGDTGGGGVDDGSAIYTVDLPSGEVGTLKAQITTGDFVVATGLIGIGLVLSFDLMRKMVYGARHK